MSGGHFDYQQYHIDEIANSIEEELEDQKKPEPPTKKVHCVTIKRQEGKGCYVYLNTYYNFLNSEDAKDYLRKNKGIIEKDGRFYDKTYTFEIDGKEYPCEYVITEGDYDEYEEGHDDCYYGVRYSEETLKEFKQGIKYLRLASIYAQRIDWLLSGDDGEESFHRRLKDELHKIK